MEHLRGEYATEYQEQKAFWELHYECDHKGKIEYRQRVLRDGSLTVWRQCSHCGEGFGAAKKSAFTSSAIQSLSTYDECLKSERYQELRRKIAKVHETLLSHQRASQENKDGEWWDWYGAYLLSPEWKKKRALVLRRAGGICEGCGINQPSQIHHLTYKHVGNEFLFELVAVCNFCHDRLHEKREQ